jgi:2-polyprenyl-6-methoxyphenol hydroxylase-like FAD-dependent oxidoreductase
MPGHVGRRAIVLGGSMAGLFAARALADAYAEVVVVDRDVLSGVAEPRRGVPQGKQVHGLQARGQQGLEELFPGITEELRRSGAVIGDMAGSVRLYAGGERMRNAHAGLVAIAVSRPFLERHVRARVVALPNVRFFEQCDVVGLRFNDDRSRVTGVVVHHQDDDAQETLDADLVVDATGRGSRTPVWLGEAGYPTVAEEKMKIGLGYATRHYRLGSDPFEEHEIELAVISSPVTPRGAIAMKVEDDRVIVTAYGMLGDHPPTDPAGFDDFVKSLQVPDIYEAMQDMVPISEPIGYKFPANLRRRYEHMARFPKGLLVTGDAVCSFNPAYGQGMTSAAVGGLMLRDHLREHGDPVARQFFRALARNAVDPPWELMTSADLSFPGVEGKRTFMIKLGHRFMGRVQVAMTRDAEVAKAFMRVFGLVERADSLMRPRMLLRVLRASRGAASH